MTSSGSAGGRIVSNPVGIDCGTDCTESYSSGRVVTLTPIAAANSKFAGWTGDTDCADGSVTMYSSKTCTAKFEIAVVTLSVSKRGKGRVASATSGIDCGAACSSTVTAGSTVSLRATADPGFVFSGWSGACTGTADCSVTLSSNTTVTANFVNFSDKTGVYRPSTGEWFLDLNGNGQMGRCNPRSLRSGIRTSGRYPRHWQMVNSRPGSEASRASIHVCLLPWSYCSFV
jgi:Divergent InlB B-repeat domain